MLAEGGEDLRKLRAKGATTVAQDAATSLVSGMPAPAVANGAAKPVLALPEIATRLRDLRLQDS